MLVLELNLIGKKFVPTIAKFVFLVSTQIIKSFANFKMIFCFVSQPFVYRSNPKADIVWVFDPIDRVSYKHCHLSLYIDIHYWILPKKSQRNRMLSIH